MGCIIDGDLCAYLTKVIDRSTDMSNGRTMGFGQALTDVEQKAFMESSNACMATDQLNQCSDATFRNNCDLTSNPRRAMLTDPAMEPYAI